MLLAVSDTMKKAALRAEWTGGREGTAYGKVRTHKQRGLSA